MVWTQVEQNVSAWKAMQYSVNTGGAKRVGTKSYAIWCEHRWSKTCRHEKLCNIVWTQVEQNVSERKAMQYSWDFEGVTSPTSTPHSGSVNTFITNYMSSSLGYIHFLGGLWILILHQRWLRMCKLPSTSCWRYSLWRSTCELHIH